MWRFQKWDGEQPVQKKAAPHSLERGAALIVFV
jgi:hypothetical protein